MQTYFQLQSALLCHCRSRSRSLQSAVRSPQSAAGARLQKQKFPFQEGKP